VGLRESDVLVDLADEDGYLAGLADQFVATGRIGVDEIRLRQSIDDAIASGTEQEQLAEIRRYRKMMHTLARALSEAAGVPLRQE
jgi:hypothetical protein